MDSAINLLLSQISDDKLKNLSDMVNKECIKRKIINEKFYFVILPDHEKISSLEHQLHLH